MTKSSRAEQLLTLPVITGAGYMLKVFSVLAMPLATVSCISSPVLNPVEISPAEKAPEKKEFRSYPTEFSATQVVTIDSLVENVRYLARVNRSPGGTELTLLHPFLKQPVLVLTAGDEDYQTEWLQEESDYRLPFPPGHILRTIEELHNKTTFSRLESDFSTVLESSQAHARLSGLKGSYGCLYPESTLITFNFRPSATIRIDTTEVVCKKGAATL